MVMVVGDSAAVDTDSDLPVVHALSFSDGEDREQKRQIRQKRTTPMIPAWIECPDGCEEFFCTIHNKHVFECDCEGVDWWVENKGFLPYEGGGNDMPSGEDE